MSTTTLPQLQVLLDNAHSFPAPTPPNSATTSSSDSPDSAKTLTAQIKSSKRFVNSPSPTSLSPRAASPAPISTPSAGGKETAPSSPLSQIKPPPTPRPWSWQCHRCYAEYKVACTRRCFECGHEFCTANNNASKRGPCRSQFDFAGWEAWGSFRRTIAQLSSSNSQGQGLNDGEYKHTKRPRKGEGRRESTDTVHTGISWASSNTYTYTDAFATWTPATEVIHDLRRGWVSSIIKTEENATSMPWTAVTAEEREKVMKKKEKMYVRREYNCWLHCDAPSECRLAVYTACFEGRARLLGNGKLTAVLLEDLNSPKKKKKKKERKERVKKKAAKLVSMLVDSSDEDGDDESGEEEGGSDKECAIMRKLRNKKNRLLYGGSSSASERRPSTAITTEHVEDRQAEDELPADGILKSETTEWEEQTTSVPRQVVWPSTEGGSATSESRKPRGLLATLINGSEGEIDIGSLPYEKDHGDEVQVPDADFAELARVSSNLAQNTGNIKSTNSSATALVSPPTSTTSFNIIRIDDADNLPLAGSQQSQNRVSTDSVIYFPPSIHQPVQQTKGFVDLKEVIDIRHVEGRAKRRKRHRSEQHSRTNQEDPDDIFSPSPRDITFRFPIWKDEGNHDNTEELEEINKIVSEYSAADLMDILDEGSSESQQSLGSNSSSGASSPSPASTAESGDMEASVLNPNRMDMTTSSIENSNGSISPLPSSSREYPSFSPVSPLDPDSKTNNDLSMYLDDEIISPVSMAAARSLNNLADEAASRLHAQGGELRRQNTDTRSRDGGNERENAATSLENSTSSQGSKGNPKDNQCEVLLTLRKMQSAFMGGRRQGEHW